MELKYIKNGDYCIPNLKLENLENQYNINKYGMLKLDWLKKNKKAFYTELLMTGKLNNYLFSVGNEAKTMVENIVKIYVEKINLIEKTFEDIKHIDKYGNEFWYAKEFMTLLEYSSWKSLYNVIKRAKISCKNSGYVVEDNFSEIIKPDTTIKEVVDYKFTRFACYLIIINTDPRKKSVALGKTYIAIQTRKRELAEKELPMRHFIMSQAEQKIKREGITDETEANKIRLKIEKDIRNMVNKELNYL